MKASSSPTIAVHGREGAGGALAAGRLRRAGDRGLKPADGSRAGDQPLAAPKAQVTT